MKGIFSGCALSVLALGTAAAASPIYVGLSGRVTDVSQNQLFADLRSRFADPLQAMGHDVKANYNYVTDGSGRFTLGLIVESTDPRGDSRLASYVAGLETEGFHGLSVKFEKVREIQESVNLLAGVHRPGSNDGAFDSNSETRKDFKLASVSAWTNFTDTLGFAFLSKHSGDFQSYLTWFLGGSEQFQGFADQVLAHDDVVFAELRTTLALGDGTSVGPDSELSPFFNLPFVRNCWEADYGHGMCYTPPRIQGGGSSPIVPKNSMEASISS